ncbi:ly6/PLAUR domain-containing protein 5-like [Phyllobates terribilis]|uniref:ly6/PLAUR domain-containing protein 5-like n=1 Tax=Phyllobates terribilis TaxID=111132 RepID=UPI003CCAD7D7
MPSTVAIFLGLITSFLFVTGCGSLGCFACNEPSDISCSRLSTIACAADDDACTAVSFSAKLGNLTENLIVKGCDKGFPMTSIISSNPFGVQILASRILCDLPKCNEDILDLSSKFPDVEVNETSDLECYSCLSTNKSQCSAESAEKVRCPLDLNTCYEAAGTITIREISFPIFIKQCSFLTNDTTINIDIDVYSLSFDVAFCSENLCNEKLLVSKTTVTPIETETYTTPSTNETETEAFTTPSTNETETEASKATTPKAKPVTSTTKKTTSGVGRICPCYLVMLMLITMKFIL